MGEQLLARDVVVRGRVQGVGFRWFTRQQAQALGVTGIARNLPDGTVEVHAEGPADALDTLVARLREGPSSARVDDVAVRDGEVTGTTTFRTA